MKELFEQIISLLEVIIIDIKFYANSQPSEVQDKLERDLAHYKKMLAKYKI